MQVAQTNLQDFVNQFFLDKKNLKGASAGEVVPVAIDVLDTTGQFYYVNQHAAALYGYAQKDLISHTLLDLAVNDQHAKELQDNLVHLAHDQPMPTPYIGLNKCKNGKVIHVRVDWDYIFHGDQLLGFITTITNLSEKTYNLERYRASEAIVNAVLQTMLFGVMILSAKGQILEVNPLAAQLLGEERNQVLGLQVNDLLVPMSAAKDVLWEDEAWMSGSVIHEYKLKKKIENRRRYLLIEPASGLVYKSLSSLIVIVKDITDDHLKAKALAEKKRVLEERYRQSMLSEMVSGLAHEMNQPLAAITNYTKGCMRRLNEQGVDYSIIQTLEMVVCQANRASNIIQHMRHWDTEDRESYARIKVKDLIAGCIRLLEFDLLEAKIELDQHIPLNCPDLYGCRIELEQVFINLFRNAIEAINQHCLDNVQSTKKISIEVHHVGNAINIIVKDSGIGISEQTVSHLFEPFFTTKNNGMGIGLALCEKIVSDHDGQLEYHACHGDYATAFSIHLPVFQVRSREQQKTAGEKKPMKFEV